MLCNSKPLVGYRAEGIGVGWVSILSNEDLRKILAVLTSDR